MNGFTPAPKILFDSRLSDVELQRLWVRGAQEALQRAQRREAEARLALEAARHEVKERQTFLNDALDSLRRYEEHSGTAGRDVEDVQYQPRLPQRRLLETKQRAPQNPR